MTNPRPTPVVGPLLSRDEEGPGRKSDWNYRSGKTPAMKCTTWEDNRSCIEVAESPKFTPRTKHIALKYHHFRQFVNDKTIVIKPIDSREQMADIFTKPIDEKQFAYLRKKLMGW